VKVLVLDSEPLSQLVHGGLREAVVRAYLEAAQRRGYGIRVPAAVLAEQYRGGRFDQALDAFLAREEYVGPERKPNGLKIADTDKWLARYVGNLLAMAQRSSGDHVDACVVATCMTNGGGYVLTTDEDDIPVLASNAIGVAIEVLKT